MPTHGPRIWTRCRLETDAFPPFLYRVHHAHAHTKLNSRGFTAQAPEPYLSSFSDSKVVTLLNRAFDAAHMEASPFVQLYTDFHVANRFAHSLEEANQDGDAGVEIWVVDGARLSLSFPPLGGPVCSLASTLERAVVGVERESVESRRGDVLVVATVSGVPRQCLYECVKADDPRRAKREGWAEEVEIEEEAEEARDFNRDVDEILRAQELERQELEGYDGL